jgi:YVTN family beta-propeller protein
LILAAVILLTGALALVLAFALAGSPAPVVAQAPTCGPDIYEPDDTQAQAKLLPMTGITQTHTFHTNTDVDWLRIEGLTVGVSYAIRTANLVGGADTYIALYDNNGVLIKSNDDFDFPTNTNCPALPQFCASAITWTPTYSGPYYLLVRTLSYPPGACPGYDIFGRPLRSYSPIVPGNPPRTPTPTPTGTPRPTHTPTSTPTRGTIVNPTPLPPVPGLTHPKGLAVNPATHLLYVTSRDSNQLFILDGLSFAVVQAVKVGREPWGVAVNGATNKVYVANFASGDVYVLDATTGAPREVIPVGPNPTFVKVNPVTNKIFVPTHGNNGVVIINGWTDTVEQIVGTHGAGTWGIAVNPTLNRLYVSNRDTGAVATLDGNNSFRVIESQFIYPCGNRGSPYGLDFNPANNKLYIACATAGDVNRAAIYQADTAGLTRLADVGIGSGGSDGGGGVAVDPATGNTFFTNSLSNTVSVIGGNSNAVVATVPVGINPFGIAADSVTRYVFVGDRVTNDLWVIPDTYAP